MKKIISTFFFGYISLKYRRLIRTIFIVMPVVAILSVAIGILKDYVNQDDHMIDEIYRIYDFQNNFYNYRDLYITPNGHVCTKAYLIDRYGIDDFNNYVKNGTLILNDESNGINSFFNRNQFVEALVKNKAVATVAYYIAEKQNFIDYNDYHNADDFVLNGLKVMPQDVFNQKIIPLILAIVMFYILIGVISYILQPFVLEKRSKMSQLLVNQNLYNSDENMISVQNNSESENVPPDLIQNSISNRERPTRSKFSDLFKFNDEYLNGNKYWLRMILGWITIPIFFVGLYIMINTVYKRSCSLGLNSIISILFAICIPLLGILSFVWIRTDFSDDKLVLYLFLNFPQVFLFFKNGTMKK